MNWPRTHYFVGLTTLLIFLLTGQYMLRVVHASHLDTGTRLLFRSRHLFLLLAAVANLALSNTTPSHRAARAASIVILLSPALLLAAFFIDPAHAPHTSTVFRIACTRYSLLPFCSRLSTSLTNTLQRGQLQMLD